MKKISFNDNFFETELVFKGIKTQIRKPLGSICNIKENRKDLDYLEDFFNNPLLMNRYKPSHKVGDIVAIAQCYEYLYNNGELDIFKPNSFATQDWYESIGKTNKLYVKPSLMPHHIKITGIRIEKVQQISDEDILKEGIIKDKEKYYFEVKNKTKVKRYEFDTAYEAFKNFIDKMWGKNIWELNPTCFIYDFEIVD